MVWLVFGMPKLEDNLRFLTNVEPVFH